MKLTVDTNVLVRYIVKDDRGQTAAAKRILETADAIVVTNACLCELVWVLRRSYRLPRHDVIAALELLSNVANVVMDRAALRTGVAILNAGGDLADGVIAYEGAGLGGDIFTSFDKKAVSLVARQGVATQLLEG